MKKKIKPFTYKCKCGWWSTNKFYNKAWHEQNSGCKFGEDLVDMLGRAS